MIAIILGFGILVLIHELGHFISARIFGVKVEKFSIGMGPSVVGFKKGDTYYQIGLIPFGGFCQFKEDALRDDIPILLTAEQYQYIKQKFDKVDSSILEKCYEKSLASNVSLNLYETIMKIENSSDKDSFISCYHLNEKENIYEINENILEKDIFVSLEFLESNKIDNFEYNLKENIDVLLKNKLTKLLYKLTDVKKLRDQDSFFGITSWKRLIIAFCGPFMNFILAVLFLAFLSGTPHKEIYLPNKILLTDDLLNDGSKVSPAKKGGLLTGDKIVKVNGNTIDSFQGLSEEMVVSSGKKMIRVVVERDGKLLDFDIVPEWDKNNLKPIIGVYYFNEPVIKVDKKERFAVNLGLKDKDKIFSLNGVTENITDIAVSKYFYDNYKTNNTGFIEILRDLQIIKVDINFNDLSKEFESIKEFGFNYHYPSREIWEKNPLKALKKGFYESNRIIYMTYIGMESLLFRPKGDLSEQLGGPIKIGYFMKTITDAGFSQNFYEGFRNFLQIVSYISLALAFFNLIPFPALDGGYILISIFEVITGKIVKMRTIYIMNFIGFTILITMAIVVAFMDISFINNILHK